MYETDYSAGAADGGIFAALGMALWVFIIATYLYMAYTQFVIAKKCGCNDTAFLAFIPIVNMFLLCQMAKKPGWWFVLMLIPFINIIFYAILWIEAAKNAGHSGVWGFLSIIPPICLIAWGVIAFGKGTGTTTSVPSRTTTPVRRGQPVA
jgi:amino acid transporter